MDVVALSPRLTPELVLEAYPQGLFPMAYVEENIITWHHPKRRAIIPLDAAHIPKRLARTMASGRFEVTFDTCFRDVMRACAADRPVWISEEFIDVYGVLHDRGHAHSVEVWSADEPRESRRLAGGLYGLALGGAFFAESKFHRLRDASKVALASLIRRLQSRDFELLEVQYLTEHLAQFGTIEIPDRAYMRRLASALARKTGFGPESAPPLPVA